MRLLGLVETRYQNRRVAGRQSICETSRSWKTDFENLKSRLTSLDGLMGLKDRLTLGWLEVPKALPEGLAGTHQAGRGDTRSDGYVRRSDISRNGPSAPWRLPRSHAGKPGSGSSVPLRENGL